MSSGSQTLVAGFYYKPVDSNGIQIQSIGQYTGVETAHTFEFSLLRDANDGTYRVVTFNVSKHHGNTFIMVPK
jgi:hypothetical protein